ncbi:PREDICTED: uncharacterized protein LOC104777474 [Camelina sativa]|uniref:Uncharacterized protein LOC104777474 n=1 Tax=Camelina sativa TaxID=90675 RepID=A0ABM0YF80_CAMSA|nr:PREDICTED: uncharacterized protein LOC104777474 [Camelina sativa]
MDYNYCVDMSCVMKVNRSCMLCRQKVTEVMHCLYAIYSMEFVGDDNSIKLKARVNPSILMAAMERYGEHGKIINLRFDGEVMNPRSGGYYGHSGYYLPAMASGAGGYYPYSYPPYACGGNYAPYTCNQQRQTDQAPRNPHTTPPEYPMPMPSARSVHSYAYVEPQYYTGSSGGLCAIM